MDNMQDMPQDVLHLKCYYAIDVKVIQLWFKTNSYDNIINMKKKKKIKWFN